MKDSLKLAMNEVQRRMFVLLQVQSINIQSNYFVLYTESKNNVSKVNNEEEVKPHSKIRLRNINF